MLFDLFLHYTYIFTHTYKAIKIGINLYCQLVKNTYIVYTVNTKFSVKKSNYVNAKI